VIRRAHDRVRGLTFSQLQPIAEGIGPASLQYSPLPSPPHPPREQKGGKEERGREEGSGSTDPIALQAVIPQRSIDGSLFATRVRSARADCRESRDVGRYLVL